VRGKHNKLGWGKHNKLGEGERKVRLGQDSLPNIANSVAETSGNYIRCFTRTLQTIPKQEGALLLCINVIQGQHSSLFDKCIIDEEVCRSKILIKGEGIFLGQKMSFYIF
jgi:hypothetical protein